MKSLEDMSDKELYEACKNGEFEKIVQIECAQLEIPVFFEDPGPEPVCEITPDYLCYEVYGMRFDTVLEAEAVSAALRGQYIIETDSVPPDYHFRHVVKKFISEDDLLVKKVRLFSPKFLEANMTELRKFEKKHEIWENKKKHYESMLKFKSQIEADITHRVERYEERLEYEQEMENLHSKYLELAEGDEDLAGKWLEGVAAYYKRSSR